MYSQCDCDQSYLRQQPEERLGTQEERTDGEEGRFLRNDDESPSIQERGRFYVTDRKTKTGFEAGRHHFREQGKARATS